MAVIRARWEAQGNLWIERSYVILLGCNGRCNRDGVSSGQPKIGDQVKLGMAKPLLESLLEGTVDTGQGSESAIDRLWRRQRDRYSGLGSVKREKKIVQKREEYSVRCSAAEQESFLTGRILRATLSLLDHAGLSMRPVHFIFMISAIFFHLVG